MYGHKGYLVHLWVVVVLVEEQQLGQDIEDTEQVVGVQILEDIGSQD